MAYLSILPLFLFKILMQILNFYILRENWIIYFKFYIMCKH